jgi:hypothetical protein
MPSFDATAKDALGASVIRPAYFGYLDILGDPFRVTTADANVTFSGTGDADLDGLEFSAIIPDFVDIGDVVQSEGGSETVTCSLSGLLNGDADTLNTLADPANWRGRKARLWVWIRDETGAAQGAIVPYYTGYMAALSVIPTPESQTIQLSIENYLAALNAASNRTYLGQKSFDPTDVSASALLASANGARRGPASGVGYGGAGGGGGGAGGGGSFSFDEMQR